MKTQEYVHVIAGSLILVSLALGVWAHQYWLFLTAFVGLNLLQYGFTKWCLMETFLHRLGVER